MTQSKPYAQIRVCAVLLAAGEGSRMGNIPKCLIQLDGQTLLQRQLIALTEAGVDAVVVVSGHHHLAVERELETLKVLYPMRVIRNTHADKGQATSVRVGIETLGSDFDAVIMALSDQPLIESQDIKALIAAFKKRAAGEIILPMFNGQRGNPIILSGSVMKTILASGKEMVCRNFMDQHPELVNQWQTQNDHYVVDIDTPKDLELLSAQKGWTFSLPNSDKA
ncbi:nucleotidyltransferase family protein [Polynucleobacter paneuropaeus]|uniref:nucleotidyltransferase family protein n=1 Tax=Polynucleobacter paneuropaeus TaxID=2527775 RepID=UPI001BFD64B3|nr:nucleotidyltransferase family protein [Polynucleobacter paneuropaeus]MBT8623010.1 nucleotidyltransferase family protein [Polynucleobacter paneuropaeus]